MAYNNEASWPSSLKTAEEVADALGISADRVLQLARDGYMPHYEIDHSCIRFRLPEVRAWAKENILAQRPGRPYPNRLVVVQDLPKPDCRQAVPNELKQIDDLRRIDVFSIGSGIYFLCLEGRLQYIGQSVNVMARIQSHLNDKTFDEVFFIPWPKEDLNEIEMALIRRLQPPLNGAKHRNSTVQSRDITLLQSVAASTAGLQ